MVVSSVVAVDDSGGGDDVLASVDDSGGGDDVSVSVDVSGVGDEVVASVEDSVDDLGLSDTLVVAADVADSVDEDTPADVDADVIGESVTNDVDVCALVDAGIAVAALKKVDNQGPVVQSIFSLTSSLRGQILKRFTTLKPNTLKFLVEKMRELKLLTFLQ